MDDPTKPLPPESKSKSHPLSQDAKDWTPRDKREYAQAQQDAYADAFAKADPAVVCTNTTGSIHSNCKCQNCSASRAAYEVQTKLTGYKAPTKQ